MVFGVLLRLALAFAYLFGVMALFSIFGPFGMFNDRQDVILGASVLSVIGLVAVVGRS